MLWITWNLIGPRGFHFHYACLYGELPLHPKNVKDGAGFYKGKKPPHASSLTPTEEANILPDICCYFSVSSSNNPFLISKVCATRFICYCLNEGYPSRNLKGNWLPIPSESSVTSRKVTWTLEPSTCVSPVPSVAWLTSPLENTAISAAINSQGHRESSLSDPLLHVHKTSLG